MVRPTVVFVAAHAQQAHLLRNLLAGYGIDARVVNELVTEDPGGWYASPRVVVPPDDVAFAQEIVRDFEATWHARDRQPVRDSGQPLEWTSWPRCPHCRHRRQTLCPVCQSAGNAFPLAEFVSPEDPNQPIRLAGDDAQGPVLLICPTCDEAFVPEFYRHCENCSFDFGSGRERPHTDSLLDQTRRRALWVLMAGLVSLLWLYCAWHWLAR